jgi:hypothetical protein
MGQWSRSKLKPQQVLGSLLAWIEQGIPVVMCGTHQRAGQYAARILYCCARRRYRELRGMVADVGEDRGDQLEKEEPVA